MRIAKERFPFPSAKLDRGGEGGREIYGWGAVVSIFLKTKMSLIWKK